MNKTKFRKNFRGRAALTCAALLALTSSFGILSACTEEETDTTKTTSNPDNQVIKNGNFEFYDDNDGIYYISSPNNWSKTSSGTASYVMSGVIDTKSSKWSAITDLDLVDTLDYNNELADNYDDDPDTYESEYDDNYVDYNGMHYYDMLYASTADAIDYHDGDTTLDETAYEMIANPETHNKVYSENGEYYYLDTDGTTKIPLYVPEVKTDDDGNYYYVDEDEEEVYLGVDDSGNVIYDYFLDAECTEAFESSVLMVHNYLTNRNGTGQYYASSTTVTLEANTAAEISVWVKTTDLYYNNGASVTQNRGAFIEVEQTVGGNSLDSFYIKDINTEKLNKDGDFDDTNGWVQYTVYVQACDYADTTITINLGFGEDGAYAVEGYAFFDDLVCTKYTSIDETSLYDSAEANLIYADMTSGDRSTYDFMTKDASTDSTTCTLLSEGNEKVFEADTETYTTQSGTTTYERYSKNYYYYIDLTASGARGTITITDNDNITIGSTVDDDDYSIGDYNGGGYNITVTDPTGIYANTNLEDIKTDNDILALLNITDSASILSALSGSNYATLMSEELAGAANLPQADSSAQTLLMLSAMGAPYTAKVTETSTANFTIDADSYFIISIWVKTSDMSGSTAATLNLVDASDDENTATITIDTTGTTTDITDNDGNTDEDIYDGWVQCFFYIQNDTDVEQSYYLELQFGQTTIKGTTVSSFTGGWAAFTNITTLEVDETEYGYASSGDNTASLTFTEEDNRSAIYFTSASSEKDIETDITKPSGYTGVNGASSMIISSEDGISSYDYADNNDYAGVINVDYFEDYLKDDLSWATALLSAAGYGYASASAAASDAATLWSEIFGTSVQPLLIVNTIRTYVDNKTAVITCAEDLDLGVYYVLNDATNTYERVTSADGYDENETYYTIKQALNYGYMSSETTLSSSTYTAISVKVKVSGSTSAYVYLTDTTADRDVLSYETPEYTFWYDSDGNVLKEAPDEDDDDYDAEANIAYALRSDGLYEDEDGNLYANLYNLTRVYTNEKENFYDEDGNLVSYEDLEENGVYYIDKNKTAYASHRLVNSDGDRVFEYSGTGTDLKAVYYYYIRYEEDDEYYYSPDTDYAVTNFDTAVATPRYVAASASDTAYRFEITDTNGKWATVNFLVYTGSESKTYRLELWSGERDQTGTAEIVDSISVADTASYSTSNGYVIFDYSYFSLDENGYTALLSEYTDKIIEEYRSILIANGVSLSELKSNDENLDYYKQLAADKGITSTELTELESKYYAYYYTYTLYDTASYYPFNEDTAEEDETGYDYTIDDYDETLAFFKYVDADNYTYNMFIDYSAVDQSIDRVANSTDDDEDEDEESDTNVWLLASSIVLVVALLLTLVAMLVREIRQRVLRRRNTKRLSRSVYSKRKRYIRQYTKANGEIETPESEPAPAENQTAETAENVEATEDQTVETQTAEDASESEQDDGDKNE